MGSGTWGTPDFLHTGYSIGAGNAAWIDENLECALRVAGGQAFLAEKEKKEEFPSRIRDAAGELLPQICVVSVNKIVENGQSTQEYLRP